MQRQLRLCSKSTQVVILNTYQTDDLDNLYGYESEGDIGNLENKVSVHLGDAQPSDVLLLHPEERFPRP